MPILNRRRMAIVLIVLGLLLLGFGIWTLVGIFWPKQSTTEEQQRQLQAVQRENAKPAPKTLEMPTTVQGTSTAEQVNAQKAPPLQDAIRRAESVLSRSGSGTNQDGFLGFNDAMQDGTSRFQNFLKSEQQRLIAQHPATGQIYGMTTRIVSSSLVQGKEGDDKVVIKVQAQKVEDAGDRSKPTNVSYIEAAITLLKQSGGGYLVDEMSIGPASL